MKPNISFETMDCKLLSKRGIVLDAALPSAGEKYSSH